MDYLKSVVPSQLLSEPGSNPVVINPGSANIRIGLASKDTPLNIPHCITWHTTQEHRRNVQDQLLNTQVTTMQYTDCQKAYDMITSFLKISFIDTEVANNSYPRKMGRIDGLNPHNSRKDTAFDWTNVYEKEPGSSSTLESSENKSTTSEGLSQHEGADTEELGSGNHKYKKVIYGEEALKISPTAPYPCPCRRRIGGMSKPLTSVLTVSNPCRGRIGGMSESNCPILQDFGVLECPCNLTWKV